MQQTAVVPIWYRPFRPGSGDCRVMPFLYCLGKMDRVLATVKPSDRFLAPGGFRYTGAELQNRRDASGGIPAAEPEYVPKDWLVDARQCKAQKRRLAKSQSSRDLPPSCSVLLSSLQLHCAMRRAHGYSQKHPAEHAPQVRLSRTAATENPCRRPIAV